MMATIFVKLLLSSGPARKDASFLSGICQTRIMGETLGVQGGFEGPQKHAVLSTKKLTDRP
jgi:hypothetical protein